MTELRNESFLNEVEERKASSRDEKVARFKRIMERVVTAKERTVEGEMAELGNEIFLNELE